MQDSFDLGLGSSFMDEIMSALTTSETRQPSTTADETLLSNDKSPLLERDPSFPTGGGKTSFDNIAMSTDADSSTENGVANGSLGESGSSIDFGGGGSRGSSMEFQAPPTTESAKKKKKPMLKIVSRL